MCVQVPQVDANVLNGTAKQQQISFYDEVRDQVATIEAFLESAAEDAPALPQEAVVGEGTLMQIGR